MIVASDLQLNGVYYRVHEQAINWVDAEKFCIDEHGGHLASVRDLDTRELLLPELECKLAIIP